MTENKKVKVILLGEAGVGKTCLITRYIENKFDEMKSSTIGTSFSIKEIEIGNNIKYTLHIWDTAGAEVYRTMNRIFYRDTAIAILVYDITERKTFEELKNYWVKEISSIEEENLSKILNNL